MTSLVAQWVRPHLPMQGTQVQSLVLEDSICHGANKPLPQPLEPVLWSPQAATTEPKCPETVFHKREAIRSPRT